MFYVIISFFYFLGFMKFIGEYWDCGFMCNSYRNKDVV